MGYAYLRCHLPQRRQRKLVRFVLTKEQEEEMEKWARIGEDEFEPPDYRDGRGASLWPFVEKEIREALQIEEWMGYYCPRAFWKPKVPVEGMFDDMEIVEIDLSSLPIEVWHPDIPVAAVSDEVPIATSPDSV